MASSLTRRSAEGIAGAPFTFASRVLCGVTSTDTHAGRSLIGRVAIGVGDSPDALLIVVEVESSGMYLVSSEHGDLISGLHEADRSEFCQDGTPRRSGPYFSSYPKGK